GDTGKKIGFAGAFEFLVPQRTGRHAPGVLWSWPRSTWGARGAVFSDSGIWLNGVEIVPGLTKKRDTAVQGLAFQGKPWRGVLHTVGDPRKKPRPPLSVDAARNTFQGNGFWPHLTIDPNGERVVQHLPLDSSSFALQWGSDHNAIQIEIVAYPDETPQFTSKQLTFILNVMQQVEGAVPIPHRSGLKFLDWKDAEKPDNAQNRMKPDEWKMFSGWCGHQHVPNNDHTDPGGGICKSCVWRIVRRRAFP